MKSKLSEKDLELLQIKGNVNIDKKLQVYLDIHNYGNTKIDNTLETNTLTVNSVSDLKGIIKDWVEKKLDDQK